MRTRLLSNWHAMRWMRLIFAFIFLFAGYAQHEPVAHAAAAFFGFQALLNVGCCGTSCPPQRTRNDQGSIPSAPVNVSYEEIT